MLIILQASILGIKHAEPICLVAYQANGLIELICLLQLLKFIQTIQSLILHSMLRHWLIDRWENVLLLLVSNATSRILNSRRMLDAIFKFINI